MSLKCYRGYGEKISWGKKKLLVLACRQCHLNFKVIPVSLLGVLLSIETISIGFFLYAILIHIAKGQKNPHLQLSAGVFFVLQYILL